MQEKKFVTVINCMDGRVQLPMIDYMKEKYSADYVDMITEQGPIKILSEQKNEMLVNSIKNRVEISITKHDSKTIIITGHYDCAGNPEPKEVQKKQIAESINLIKSWGTGATEVTGLWIDDKFEVKDIIEG